MSEVQHGELPASIVDAHPILSDMKLPGPVIYAKVWGSRSHNTHKPDSDTDYLAVYSSHPDDLLGIDDPKETVDREKPDVQAHEAKKFCKLLLKGNPGILEMLWTEKMEYVSAPWLALKKHRDRFLSCEAVKQYLGYAEGQLKKLAHHGGKGGLHTKGGDYNEKWAYHIVRLLTDARRIAKGEGPLVWKDEGVERALLMDIRANKFSREAVESLARSLMIQIEECKPWPLPEVGDKDFLNRWLLAVRAWQLGELRNWPEPEVE